MTTIATVSLIAVAVSVLAVLLWPRAENGNTLRSGALITTAIVLFLWSIIPATYVDRRQTQTAQSVHATQVEELTSKSAELIDVQAQLTLAQQQVSGLQIELDLLKKTTSSEREKLAASSAALEQRLQAALDVVAHVDEVTKTVTFTEAALFPKGRSDLNCESRENLSRLVPWLAVRLNRTPGVEIQIEGHTDTDGPLSVNQKLATDRADVVRRYLEDAGVTSKNLVSKPLWWQRPVGQTRLLSLDEARQFNQGEPQKERNRRVEIVPIPPTASK